MTYTLINAIFGYEPLFFLVPDSEVTDELRVLMAEANEKFINEDDWCPGLYWASTAVFGNDWVENEFTSYHGWCDKYKITTGQLAEGKTVSHVYTFAFAE